MKSRSVQSLDAFIASIRPHYLETLTKLVSIPTVSSDPDHRRDIIRGARVCSQILTELGFKAKVIPTAGHPVVFGTLITNSDWPTVLIYNHMDVQPADPARWESAPFELTVQGDKFFGRGSTDDKGPALAVLEAVSYAISSGVELNFSLVWEFEEEIGSVNFADFVEQHASQLRADSVLVSDTIWADAKTPAIPTGLRGLLTFEMTLTTADGDVHSGTCGGAARNPVGELCQIIAECYDESTGHVNVPGFYDNVLDLSADDPKPGSNESFDISQFKTSHGLHSLRTTDPAQAHRSVTTEPTFEVHAIIGGPTGPGVKTVVPATATAKISARLVPGQHPKKIFKQIESYIRDRHPDVQFVLGATAEPYYEPAQGPYARAAASACREAIGHQPVFIREGGSIGAIVSLKEQLNVPILLLGLSLPEHGYHAANEHFDWQQADHGIRIMSHYFERIALIKPS